MSDKKPIVAVGIFKTSAQARAAVDTLRAEGFDDDVIGILTHGDDGDPEVETLKDLTVSKAGTGAAIGAASGVAGAALWGVGVVSGLIPVVGPVLAGGVLAAVIAGSAAAGGLAGVLTSLGASDEEAVYYDSEFALGRTIVAVKSHEKAMDAYSALHRHGSTNKFAEQYL